jgi:hypothetical protein
MTGSIYCDGALQVGNSTNNVSALLLLYGDGTTSGSNYQIISSGDVLSIQQYKPSGPSPYNEPISINDNKSIIFQTGNMLLNNSIMLDSHYNQPMYKQIFNNLSGNIANTTIQTFLFNVPIYTKLNNYDYGINYGEILFSYLSMTFTSITAFPTGLTASVYLASSSTSFNSAVSNKITIPISNTSGSANYNFVSSIPIMFYYNNTTNFKTLYLCCSFSSISINSYTLSFNGNGVITGSVTGVNTGTITLNT